MQENLQEQQQKPKKDKRLLYTILILFAWLLFAFVLLMCSSKCARASENYIMGQYTPTNMSNNSSGYYQSISTGKYYWGYTNNYMYEYDPNNNTYTRITFTAPSTCTQYMTSENFWYDRLNNVEYYSSGTTHCKVDFANRTMTSQTFYIDGGTTVPSFSGQNVWSDNLNTLVYSSGATTYAMNWTTNDDSIRYVKAITYSGMTYSAYNTNYKNYIYTTDSGSVYYLSGNYKYYIAISGETVGTNGSYPTTMSASTFTPSTNTAAFQTPYFFKWGVNSLYSIVGTYTGESNGGIVYTIDLTNRTATLINTDNLPFSLPFGNLQGHMFKYVSGINYTGILYSYSYYTFYSYDLSASGGYDQNDLDQAYADGQLNALNVMSSSTHGTGTTYSSYSTNNVNTEMNNSYNAGQSAGYSSGVTQGENNVTSNPNNYDLYTQTQYNNYGTSQYNSGYTAGYTAGANSSTALAGKVYVANLVSDYEYNLCVSYDRPSCNHYVFTNSNYSDEAVSTLLELLDSNSRIYEYYTVYLDLANSISSSYGSGTTYSDPDTAPVDFSYELNVALGNEYDRGYNNASLNLLNSVSSYSPPNIGSGTTYTSFDLYDLYDEISGIYASGIANGSENASNYQTGYQDAINAVRDCPSCFDYVPLDTYNSDIDLAEANSYSLGYHDGINTDSADLPHAIVAVASVPHVVLSSLLGFEVLGVNLWVFFTGIIGLLLVIWLIKHFWK